jgi:D-serine deaminase-like pyridoxal phosphate-dependent protein
MGWLYWLGSFVLLVVILLLLKPRDRGGPYDAYFSGLNKALRDAKVGRARILIDLDRLDHNLETILAHIPSAQHYRLVVKSIPCIDLLKTIQNRSGSHKFMVVHQPFLNVILDNFSEGIDILLGKPLPLFALMEFFDGLEKKLVTRAQKEIQWLVDSPRLLSEYLVFAREHNLLLRISVELDIGLHRGGVDSNKTLDEMLDLIAANPQHLKFSGYMGYEGHAAHAVGILTSARKAAVQEFDTDMRVYSDFIDHGKASHPALFTPDLTFNSGGSCTYSLFDRAPFITDIGIGGAVLRPASYPAHFLFDLLPAEFVFTPMIKQWQGANIPFLEGLGGLFRWWNPNDRCSFGIYGGSWAGNIVAPPGLHPQMLTSDDPANENLVPNESILNGSSRVGWQLGDFAFYHPKQSDAMFQFEDILLIRQGTVVGTWQVFDRRY